MVAAGEEFGQAPAAGCIALAVTDGVQRIDVEACGLGLCMPQRNQATAQLGLIHQVGAVQQQLDSGDGDVLHLRDVDHVATELAVEHDDHGAAGAGDATDEAVAHQRQAVVVDALVANAIAGGEDHDVTSRRTSRAPQRLRDGSRRQRGPQLQRFGRPLIEPPISERETSDVCPRFHPQEGTCSAEMSERLRRIVAAGPVRPLVAADLGAQPPRAVVVAADAGHQAGQPGELHRAELRGALRAEQSRCVQLGDEPHQVVDRAAQRRAPANRAASVAVMPSGASTASLQILGEGHLRGRAERAPAASSMPVLL